MQMGWVASESAGRTLARVLLPFVAIVQEHAVVVSAQEFLAEFVAKTPKTVRPQKNVTWTERAVGGYRHARVFFTIRPCDFVCYFGGAGGEVPFLPCARA